jgi:hypothetical protein
VFLVNVFASWIAQQLRHETEGSALSKNQTWCVTGKGKTFKGVLAGTVLLPPPSPAISLAQNIGCTN